MKATKTETSGAGGQAVSGAAAAVEDAALRVTAVSVNLANLTDEELTELSRRITFAAWDTRAGQLAQRFFYRISDALIDEKIARRKGRKQNRSDALSLPWPEAQIEVVLLPGEAVRLVRDELETALKRFDPGAELVRTICAALEGVPRG